MYIDLMPNRGSKRAILLRKSIREGKRITKRTIANVSALTLEQAKTIRLVLKSEKLALAGGGFDCIRSLPHGHVEAVRIPCGGWGSRSSSTARRLASAISSRRWSRAALSRLRPASWP
jgi:hypothetical protein